jgi:hypothetical protein
MARKPSSGTSAASKQATPDLRVELSMDDFEAMISDAAQELADEAATDDKAAVAQAAGTQTTGSQAQVVKAPKNLKAAAPAEIAGGQSYAQASAQPNLPRAANAETAPAFIPPAANDLKKGRTFDPFNRKPSSAVYWAVGVLSVLWVAAGYFIATNIYGAELFNVTGLSSALSRPGLIAVLIAVIVPVIGFWSFALLVRRAQEMRIAAQSLTDVAYRLVDPEGMAEERLTTISQAVRREVSAMSEGIERTFSRAVELESLLHTEVHELERAYSDNEGRMRGILDGLGNERQSIIGQAERVRTSLAGAREQMAEEISQAVETLRSGVATVSSELSMTLDLSREGLLASLQETGETVEARISERTNALNAALASSGDTLATIIDTRSEALSGLIDSSTTEFAAQFDSRLSSVESNLLERGQQIINDLDAKTTSLSEGTERLNNALDARARQINETLSERSREIAQTFIEGRDSFGGLIDEGKQSLAEELQGFVISAGTVIDDSADRLARRVADIRTGLEGNLTAEVDRVEATLTTHRDTFSSRLDGFEDAFAARTSEFDQRVSAHSIILDESISRKSAELDNKIAGHVSSIAKVVGERAAAIEQAVSTGVGDFEATLATRVADLRRTLDETGSNIENGVVTATTRLETTFNSQTADFDTMMAERSSELAATLGARSLEIEASIQAATERASAAFSGQNDFITTQTAALEGALQRGMNGVGEALGTASRNAGETLRGAVREATALLSTEANQASQILGDRHQSFANSLTSALETTEGALAARVGSLEATFNKGQQRLASQAEHLGKQIGDIENVFERADQRILTRTRETAEELGARANAVGAALEAFDTSLAGRLSGLEDIVTAKTDATVARLEEASRNIERSSAETGSIIDQRARELSASLATHSMEIARILHDSGEPLAARLETSSQTFRSALEEAAQSSTGRLAAERDNLSHAFKTHLDEAADQFEARAASASGRAHEVGETLSNQVNQLVDRLSNSNSRLGQLVELTGKSFIDIDKRLTATTDTFGARTERAAREISTSVSMLEGNIGRLGEISSGTLGEVAGIVNKFDEHSHVLERANELLTAAQSNLQHTLEDRREALDSLAAGLVVRSKEIEAVMGAMSGQIESTLERSEHRTKSSAASLQNTVSAVFDAATTKFADATSNLERASNLIRQELDATRDELRRGLVDLPAETRQTTETLRRAVTDQIAALRELSEVMSKNTRNRDVREPVAAREEMREVAPRRMQVEPSPTAYAELQPGPVPAQRPKYEPRIADERAPSPAGGAGWVSTLLRSASQSDVAPAREPERRPAAPERKPNQVIESLNSISVDIARAIDHNAAVELWDRYRRGERDVFTRRLYTIRGQETFDDIRRKHDTDRDFRLSVTRYCEDFEKLLSDVARTDPEGKAAHRYLTSDTGKVYTMLAHASGRLR